MTKSFEYESASQPNPKSEHYARLEVSFTVVCETSDDTGTYEDLQLWNIEINGEVQFEALPEAERRAIDARAQKIADEYSEEAFQAYAESRADAMYDSWKDD